MSSDAQQALARGAALTGHFRVLGAPAVGSALTSGSVPAAGSVPDATASWIRLRDIATSAGLERIIAQVRRALPGASDTVAAALFASSVAGALAAPITGALLAERRAALPDGDQTWLRPAFTGVDAIAIGHVALTVLPDDPLARRPGAETAPDIAANVGGAGPEIDTVADVGRLRVTVLNGYRALLVPLLDLVAATTRRGRRALWADAGDRLATYLLLAGRALGDQRAGREEADALLALAEPPLRHRVRWLEFDCRGAPTIWKQRSVCCLIYQAPTFRGQYCATCPLVPIGETVERTRAWLGR